MRQKGLVAILLLVLLSFLIPIEHVYDKALRHFSSQLIPSGIFPVHYDKKIALYFSDFLSITLLCLALFSFRLSPRKVFFHPLWCFFFCLFFSILFSPYSNYPLPYIHLIRFFSPIALFSFLSHALNEEEKSFATRSILTALFSVGCLEACVGIAQYFSGAPVGLRIFSEPKHIDATIAIANKALWLLDPLLGIVRKAQTVIRATGTLPHPNAYGGFMMLSVLASYPLILLRPQRSWIIHFGLAVQIFALFLSFSRSAMIGWILASTVFLSLIFYKKGLSYLKPLLFTLFISTALSTLLLYEQLVYRGSIVQAVVAPDNIRIYYQNLSMKIIQSKPFFGLGFTQYFEQAANYFPDTPPMFTAPHNIFLFIACETGLISLGFFLFFIAKLLWQAILSPVTLYSSIFLSIFLAFLFIGFCDFYPILCQPGRMIFFLAAALLSSHAQKPSLKTAYL